MLFAQLRRESQPRDFASLLELESDADLAKGLVVESRKVVAVGQSPIEGVSVKDSWASAAGLQTGSGFELPPLLPNKLLQATALPPASFQSNCKRTMGGRAAPERGRWAPE